MLAETTGTRIKDLIREKNTTQEALSLDVFTHPSTMSQYINRKRCPNAEVLMLIAKSLNVSSDYILGMTDYKKPINVSSIEKKITVSNKLKRDSVIRKLSYEIAKEIAENLNITEEKVDDEFSSFIANIDILK